VNHRNRNPLFSLWISSPQD